ncbi:amidase signature domain-containing protein [Camillea tinctor]|nr:amidase signature domain-containing protein [Camillea tinctor]
MGEKREWEAIASQKRQEQAALLATAINNNIDVNSDDNIKINNLCGRDVIQRISSGQLTAKSVIQAYIAHLTEVMFDDAIKDAEELDRHLSRHGTTIGPLHGVPITLKDQFNVKGSDSTLGYVGRAFKPAQHDCALVKLLRSLGGVIMAKTNIPQSIMWCETENPLWGLTTNPLHPGYTPGGSTGGEAAMLSCGASLLGWGTDIGGSIRIPSHMMGLYGFKPSSARLPYRGVPVSTEGQEHVPSAVGPLARSLDMIQLAMESIIGKQPWDFDARCIPIPWRDDMYKSTFAKPLTVGVLLDDEVVRPHPPITRVLRAAVEALRAAGHHIVEWNAQLHPECIQVMDLFYTADGGEDIRTDVTNGGEPFIPHVERLINRGQPISVYAYWQLNKKKWELQQAYFDKWNSIRSPKTGQPVDVVLMPPMPHTAVPHGGCRWVGYTKVWNFVDYPALVIPGGKVEMEDVSEPWDYLPRGELDEWNQKLWADNKTDMAKLNLPVGVQLIGRKHEEEKVLAAGKILDELLRDN